MREKYVPDKDSQTLAHVDFNMKKQKLFNISVPPVSYFLPVFPRFISGLIFRILAGVHKDLTW